MGFVFQAFPGPQSLIRARIKSYSVVHCRFLFIRGWSFGVKDLGFRVWVLECRVERFPWPFFVRGTG